MACILIWQQISEEDVLMTRYMILEQNRLEADIAELDARVSALEAQAGAPDRVEALDRVGRLADDSVRALFDMVRALRRSLRGDAPN